MIGWLVDRETNQRWKAFICTPFQNRKSPMGAGVRSSECLAERIDMWSWWLRLKIFCILTLLFLQLPAQEINQSALPPQPKWEMSIELLNTKTKFQQTPNLWVRKQCEVCKHLIRIIFCLQHHTSEVWTMNTTTNSSNWTNYNSTISTTPIRVANR